MRVDDMACPYMASGKGRMYCADPANSTLLRYEMTAKIRRKAGPDRNGSEYPSTDLPTFDS